MKKTMNNRATVYNSSRRQGHYYRRQHTGGRYKYKGDRMSDQVICQYYQSKVFCEGHLIGQCHWRQQLFVDDDDDDDDGGGGGGEISVFTYLDIIIQNIYYLF